MDFQTQAAIVFIIILVLVLYAERKKLHLQKILYPIIYILMYRTKVGLKMMDNAAKRYPRFFRYAGYAGVFIGFVGMGMICYGLIENLVRMVIEPTAPSGAALVLPFRVKGALYVPFFYWLICIFVLVIIHEFSHGVMSRLYNVKIKSSGLAFLGLIIPVVPAAFVEPEEKQLAKKPRRQQLSVFAAGSFSNIVLGFLCLAVFLLVFRPAVGAMVEENGVLITGLQEDDNVIFPAQEAGMQTGEMIIGLDGNEIKSASNLSYYMENKSPGDVINITTNRTTYSVELGANPENISLPVIGIYLESHTRVKPSFEEKYTSFIPNVIIWITGLIIWLFVLNVGIGLFNLVPIPITDGGRMMYLALLHYFDEKKAVHVWKAIATFFILLILINIGFGFVR